MNVDFNNLRVSAMIDMSKLIDFLNNQIDSDGVVESFDAEDIEDIIGDLRNAVVFISAVFEEGNEDFADVSGKISIGFFNEIEDD